MIDMQRMADILAEHSRFRQPITVYHADSTRITAVSVDTGSEVRMGSLQPQPRLYDKRGGRFSLSELYERFEDAVDGFKGVPR